MTVVRIGGRDVAVIDADCEHRPCFQLGFDKGPFTPGVGYTSYHRSGPRAVCWTRHLSGCPHAGFHVRCGDCHRVVSGPHAMDDQVVMPRCPCGGTDTYRLLDVHLEPSPCCANVDVPKPRRGQVPRSQRCRSCGTTLRGRRLELARIST